MELFLALGLPIVLLIGLTLLFMTDGIPSWLKQLRFKKFNAKCSKYGKLFLPKNYQKGDFSY